MPSICGLDPDGWQQTCDAATGYFWQRGRGLRGKPSTMRLWGRRTGSPDARSPGQPQEPRYGTVSPSFPSEGVPKVTAPTGTFPGARGEGEVSGSGP